MQQRSWQVDRNTKKIKFYLMPLINLWNFLAAMYNPKGMRRNPNRPTGFATTALPTFPTASRIERSVHVELTSENTHTETFTS